MQTLIDKIKNHQGRGINQHWLQRDEVIELVRQHQAEQLQDAVERVAKAIKENVYNPYAGPICGIEEAAKAAIAAMPSVADYEQALADHRRLVRDLDIALNGENAAPQASLCDIVAQVKGMTRQAQQPVEWTCKHEPFEGRCVHCDIMFVGGEPVINKGVPMREAVTLNPGDRRYLITVMQVAYDNKEHSSRYFDGMNAALDALLARFEIRRRG